MSGGTGETLSNGSAGSNVSTCLSFQYAGMFVDFYHPLQCGGTVRSWSYCSNTTGWSAYLTVWRNSTARGNYLDRVYLQELNNKTVPRCPGSIVPYASVEVREGDYLGLLVPLDLVSMATSRAPQFVCETCKVGSRLGFVQALTADDERAYATAMTWNKSLFMPLDACLVGISAVIGKRACGVCKRAQ